MAAICPCVTAEEPHAFREQMERIAPFAERIHIDFMDGTFAATKSPSLTQAWWPHSIKADLHLMYQKPAEHLDAAIKLEPHMVIVHAEADGDFVALAESLHNANIKVGVALLSKTGVETIKPVMELIDHVLIFAGDLGHFGGKPNIEVFAGKVRILKENYSDVEMGWDGGVSDKNAGQLVTLGVDVLNVGGFIQKSEDPAAAYATLKAIAENHQ